MTYSLMISGHKVVQFNHRTSYRVLQSKLLRILLARDEHLYEQINDTIKYSVQDFNNIQNGRSP